MHAVKKRPDGTIAGVERWMTIDPGLNGHTGWAKWYGNIPTPYKTGVTKAWTGEHWEQEARLTALEILTASNGVNAVFIEMPEFWAGSVKSYTSTAKGDLFKLSFLVGCISAALGTVPLNLLTPRQWKGQLKKAMVDRRIFAAIGKEYPEHISDAVGMGLFLKGML